MSNIKAISTDYKFSKSIVADQVADFNTINTPTTLSNPSFLVHLAFEGIDKEEQVRIYINDLVNWLCEQKIVDDFTPIDGEEECRGEVLINYDATDFCQYREEALEETKLQTYSFANLFEDGIIDAEMISRYLNCSPVVSEA